MSATLMRRMVFFSVIFIDENGPCARSGPSSDGTAAAAAPAASAMATRIRRAGALPGAGRVRGEVVCQRACMYLPPVESNRESQKPSGAGVVQQADGQEMRD